MGSCTMSSLPLHHVLFSPCIVSRDSLSVCCYRPLKQLCKLSKRGFFDYSNYRKAPKIIAKSVGWRGTSNRSRVGKWEEPDQGSDSDCDEDGDEVVEENDLDYESDWEDDNNSSVVGTIDKQKAVNYEDELAKEIDQLLEPEERAILDRNLAPNLEKISTAKWRALHTLALAGQIHLLDQLLENGVSIDSVDKDGRTALHVSVIGKKEAVVSHLLRKGANPHVKDKDDVTPLHHGVQVGAMQTVKLLIKHNVDVNLPDNEGWTPLHVAMQSRNRDITKVLLVNGADRNRKNKDGKTPLDLCLAYGKDFKSFDLAKLLKLVPSNRDL